ncbi:MAG: ABC transporter substrate-binding protein, partial [Candidatus Methylomirabilales bacterium]
MHKDTTEVSRRTVLKGLGMTGALVMAGPWVRLARAGGTVKMGVLVPLTGALAEFGGAFQRAAELAVKHLKAAGLDVELVVGDTETSAIPAQAAARKLVNVNKVPVILGAAASGVSIPVAESVTIPNKVVQISNASTSPLITVLPADKGQDYLFRTCPSDALQGVVLGMLAKDQGIRKASVLYVNNPYGQGLAEQFKKSFEHRGGKVLEMIPHDEKPAPTYVAELRKATGGKPDVLVALSYPGHATIYLREAIEQGFIKKFLFVDGTKSQEIIKAVGAQNLEGMVGTAPGSALTDATKVFNEEYKKAYGELPPLPFMTNMYDAAAVAALAIKAAMVDGEAISGSAIRTRLRKVANPPGVVVGPGKGLKKAVELLGKRRQINYEGAAGSVDFDEAGEVVTPVDIWKFTEGKIVTVR